MSEKVAILRVLVNARLAAAAEEIFALVERTIVEYEEEVCRCKEENQRKQQLLDSVLSPQVPLHTTQGVQTDFSLESRVKQETPETPQIKEEQRLKQEEEHLPECIVVCVKSEESEEQSDNEEECETPASSSSARMETEADGDHYNTPQIKEEPEEQSSENIIIGDVFSLYGGNKKSEHSADKPFSCPVEGSNIKEHPKRLTRSQTINNSLLHQQATRKDFHLETEEQSDNEEECEPSAAQMETEADGDHYNQVQIKDTSSDAHYSGLFSKYKCGAAGGATVTETGHASGTGAGGRGEVGGAESRAVVTETGHASGTGAGEGAESRATVTETGHASGTGAGGGAESRATVTETGHASGTGAGGGDKKFECSFCQKKFTIMTNLKIHTRTHTGEKPYSCPVCEKTFAQQSNLKTHVRTHTGERPYSCSYCKNSFAQKQNLSIHMRSHTGEKPYSCSICKKTFAQKGSLKTHTKLHTGEGTFSCSICMKTFLQRSGLNMHMTIHTGEKPFSCSVCSNTYALKYRLQEHMRTHTGEKPYSCSYCEKSFARKKKLQAHMRHTHWKETLKLSILLPKRKIS